jgi:hypothetical protein
MLWPMPFPDTIIVNAALYFLIDQIPAMATKSADSPIPLIATYCVPFINSVSEMAASLQNRTIMKYIPVVLLILMVAFIEMILWGN